MSYQPFPAFAEWGANFDSALVDAYAERLRHAKKEASQDRLDAVLEEALRSAAVDTNALDENNVAELFIPLHTHATVCV